MNGKPFEYLVVGSGCTAAMAAQTLVEAGLPVTILDAGVNNPAYTKTVPRGDFATLRKTDEDQYKYLIGERAEGVLWGDIAKGAQLTPLRHHMTERVSEFLPLKSHSFSPLESLAYGGLGIAWGLQAWQYSDAELGAVGLNPVEMREAYEVIAKRIGVSGVYDDAGRYTLGHLQNYQPAIDMDRNHRRIYEKYAAKRESLNAKGLYMGRTPLALLSQKLGRRKAYGYDDMDFYHDNDLSAWRPWITIDDLRQKPNCTYIGGYVVLSFKEKKQHTEVYCMNVETREEHMFTCRRLVLATGTFGSARIVMRSFPDIKQLPMLCNPYAYIPALQPAYFGADTEPHKLDFAQLSMIIDPTRNNFDISVASLYSYQSLMIFRVINQAPVGYREARVLMRYLLPGVEIMGVHHPDAPSESKFVSLVKDKKSPTGDALEATYALNKDEKARLAMREKQIIAAMRRLGVFAFKRLDPGYGSSIHYAGTLPYGTEEKPGTLAVDGRVAGTRSVFVVDGSGFRYLPARGLTMSLMANAHLKTEALIQKS